MVLAQQKSLRLLVLMLFLLEEIMPLVALTLKEGVSPGTKEVVTALLYVETMRNHAKLAKPYKTLRNPPKPGLFNVAIPHQFQIDFK